MEEIKKSRTYKQYAAGIAKRLIAEQAFSERMAPEDINVVYRHLVSWGVS